MIVRKRGEVEPVASAEGIEKRVVLGPAQGAPTFVMRVFDLLPGKSSPYHQHPWEHEVFVLAGEITVKTEDGESVLGPEDAVLVMPDELHCLRNTGSAISRFMCLVPLRGEDTP